MEVKRLPDSSVSSLIWAGWRQERQLPSGQQKLVPTFLVLDNCLMVTEWDFLEMEASQWLNDKSRKESVAKGWLSTLCCWEAAVHTLD